MIPRILVPKDARPLAPDVAAAPPRRLATALDKRTLVPSGLPVVPLDGKTSIPVYLPLDVLAERIVVPRDMPATPLEATSHIPQHMPLTVLDSRVAVPKNLLPTPIEPKAPVSIYELPEVLEPDVMNTGEVNLLVKPVDERVSHWQGAARVASIAFHSALVVFLLFEPKIFPYHPPTQAELEVARQRLNFIYLPPPVTELPKIPATPQPPSPRMRIDPRLLRKIAPPNPRPEVLPGASAPERGQRDGAVPTPAPQLPAAPQPRTEPPREQARLEPPKAPEAPTGLVLPRTSPGKAIQQDLRDALKEGRGGGASAGGFGGAIPPSPGGGVGGQAYGALQMLTPDEGVDFTNYLARVLASVKRNWYSVIPESARLGEKGRVILQFRIMRDGSVPYTEPALVATSGKEPLDRAALSSIHASNPFEPLPPAFSGPYIELRFIFLYNLPLNYQ